jgi:hypothetical protein
MQEVAARDGKIILLSDPQGAHGARCANIRDAGPRELPYLTH